MALPPRAGAGDLLRQWRQRRRLSQLELAGDAEISTRHLSFVENGRSSPSRGMLQLLQGPVNVLRLSLHPRGLAPRIDNLAEWRAHLLARLQQQVDRSGDARLVALHAELAAYPARARDAPPHDDYGGIAVPLRLRLPGLAAPLSLISTTTVFGTPVDVTLSELALECFYPADEGTREALQRLAGREGGQ